MSKSILVINTPETCENCECKYPSYRDDSLYDCAITGKRVPIDGMAYGDKPDWCPLQEVPSKREDSLLYNAYVKGTVDGYNACIEEIIK